MAELLGNGDGTFRPASLYGGANFADCIVSGDFSGDGSDDIINGTTDWVNGDHFVGGGVSTAPAVAGYPHITVPMGQVRKLPVGLSLVGAAWSEGKLISYAYAFEQATHHRKAPFFAQIVP